MGALSRWAVRKPWMALAAYAVLAIVIVTLGTVWKGTLNDSFSLPDTESKTATDLLTTAGGQASAATASTATIIWKPASGSAVDAATVHSLHLENSVFDFNFVSRNWDATKCAHQESGDGFVSAIVWHFDGHLSKLIWANHARKQHR